MTTIKKPESGSVLHFVGIGGIGMSALAQWAVEEGFVVSGSNEGINTQIALLEGIVSPLYTDHHEDYLNDKVALLIYSEAVPEDNPERKKASKLGIYQVSYFEFLGVLSQDLRTVALAGTHGKTTTTGMMAAGSKGAGISPTVVVGATLPILSNKNFSSGEDDWFLVEACEYRENFRFLSPEVVVLTNVELDHVDYYKSESQYVKAFISFCKKAKVLIYHENDRLSVEIASSFSGTKVPVNTQDFMPIDLGVTGDHNRDNAALTVATAQVLGWDENRFRSGLQKYSGASRRQEYLAIRDGVTLWDDYGHHPAEIIATVQAMREKSPQAKLGVIFEPHQFSRTKQFLTEFQSALSSADKVGIFPIYEARDTEEDIAAVGIDSLLSHNSDWMKVSTKEEFNTYFKSFSEGDMIIFMGAGRISEWVKSEILRS